MATHINKAALLVVRDGKLLVARSFTKEKFYVPGGKPEPGETIREALIREIREELNVSLDGDSVEEFGVFTALADGKHGGVEVTMHCFTGELDGEPLASQEIEELAWVGVDEREQLSAASQLVLDDIVKKGFIPTQGAEVNRRAVIFDLDDTLFFTREAKWNHHRYVAKESFGVDLTDEVLARYWGMPFAEMIGHYYQNSAPVEQMLAANQQSRHLFPKTPIPGAKEKVDQLLNAGISVGVVTSTRTDWALRELVEHGFPVERFTLIQGSDAVNFHKPDSRVFDRALAILKALGKTDFTYVGDALIDEQAAVTAGMKFVAVETGLFSDEDFHTSTPVFNTVAVADI
ncbi:MAG: HAD hydrolase-like protein [Rothia sp. (in: high G+C Gram-positive bacteria)]|nr:HAD hydrolase-like protein [Rothia sp. (in: high G+C Gram-positive bacteria)]